MFGLRIPYRMDLGHPIGVHGWVWGPYRHSWMGLGSLQELVDGFGVPHKCSWRQSGVPHKYSWRVLGSPTGACGWVQDPP